jgi:hypothetical protein
MNFGIGIFLHKWAETLTLGIAFIKNKVKLLK